MKGSMDAAGFDSSECPSFNPKSRAGQGSPPIIPSTSRSTGVDSSPRNPNLSNGNKNPLLVGGSPPMSSQGAVPTSRNPNLSKGGGVQIP